MALTAVVAPLDSVTVTLNGPRAAVFEADSFNLRVRFGCFLVTLLAVTDTTVIPGFDVVTVALASRPVPETFVVSFLPCLIVVLENPVIVGPPLTVTTSDVDSVVPSVFDTAMVTVCEPGVV